MPSDPSVLTGGRPRPPSSDALVKMRSGQRRLFQLVVNARALSNFGRIADAAQCYDILFAVCPSDLGVAEEYFNALTALRRTEDAAKVRAHIDSRRLKLRMAEVAEREKKAGHEKKEGAK